MNWRRIESFLRRLRWMTPLAGGIIRAGWLLIQIRNQRHALHRVQYSGQPVYFRVQDEQALREVFATQEYGFLDAVLRRGGAPRILDIGAHIGTFAIWCLGVAPAARIVSVEADPETAAVAERNAAIRRKSGADWLIVNAAAGAQDGAVLRLSAAGPSMSHRIDPAGAVQVHSLSLASLIERLAPDGGEIDLMKVDIEGSEEEFLCSHPELLVRIRALAIELHPSLCDAGRVLSLLQAEFPRVTTVEGRTSSKPLLYCAR